MFTDALGCGYEDLGQEIVYPKKEDFEGL
jgi:hypothetical protein